MTATFEASLVERLINPSGAPFDPASARAILRLRFPKADADRLRELLDLHDAGNVTAEQEAELEAYDRIGTLLSLLQSKSRLALKRHGEASS